MCESEIIVIIIGEAVQSGRIQPERTLSVEEVTLIYVKKVKQS